MISNESYEIENEKENKKLYPRDTPVEMSLRDGSLETDRQTDRHRQSESESESEKEKEKARDGAA